MLTINEFADAVVKGTYTIINNIIDVQGSVEIKLQHCPEIRTTGILPYKFGVVTGNFKATFLKLKSLQNFPSHVEQDFDISYNEITSLQYFPICYGVIRISGNKKLTSLQGLQNRITEIIANNCGLTAIDCDSIEIAKDADFSNNKLRSFPNNIIIKGNLDLSDNLIMNEVMVKNNKGEIMIFGSIMLDGNPVSPGDEMERNTWG